jgi:ribonuclease I
MRTGKTIKILTLVISLLSSFYIVTSEEVNNFPITPSLDDGVLPEDYEENFTNGFLQRKNDFDSKIAPSAGPGITDYDFYVFSLGWSPAYCLTVDTKSCYTKLNALKDAYIMRIHGLWPSLKDGSRLPECHTGAEIQVEPKEGVEPYSTMEEIWPSLNKNHEFNFWTHEYNKHGYCYSVKYQKASYIPFFQTTIDLFAKQNYAPLMKKAFPSQPGQDVTSTYNEIIRRFADVIGQEYFELICTRLKGGNQLLTEVRFYFDLDFNTMPGFKYHTNCQVDKEIIIVYHNK